MVHNFQSFLSVFTQVVRKIGREVTRKEMRDYDESGQRDRNARAQGRFQRVVKCDSRRSGGFRFLKFRMIRRNSGRAAF